MAIKWTCQVIIWIFTECV